MTVSSLSCPSASSCIAVGTYFDDNNVQQGLLLTYVNGNWQAAKAPVPAGAATDAQVTNNLEHAYVNDVSCWAIDNCIAVGTYMLTSGQYMTMSLLLSAGTWSATSVSPPSNASTTPDPSLTTVACDPSGTCAAFGTYIPTGDSIGEAELATNAGGSWSSAEAPVPSGSSNSPNESVSAAACLSTGTCMAVGKYVDVHGFFQAVVLQQSSNGWSATAVPIPGEDTTQQPWVSINALACPAIGSCIADGTFENNQNQTFGAFLQQTSLGWTAQQAPLPPDWAPGTPFVSLGPNSLSCAAVGDCTAVGSYNTEASTDTLIGDAGMVLTESNGSWTLATQEAWPFGFVPGETGSPMASALSGVSCSTTESCWAFGFVKQEAGGNYELVAESITTTDSSSSIPPSATSSLPASSQITIGQTDSEVVTVTGGATYGSPTGTVAFYECGPTASAAPCASQANLIGSPVSLAPGTGDTATVSAPSFTPTSTGIWCFAGYYSGDTNYQPSSDTTTDGCFDVIPAPESTATNLIMSVASVPYGSESAETFSGSVIGQAGDGYPKGSVTIKDASSPLCSVSLGVSSGDSVSYSCRLSAVALAANTYGAVSATYAPTAQSSSNSNFVYTTSSSTPSLSFTVSAANQTATFTSSPPPHAIVGGPMYLPTASGGASGNPVVISVDGESAAVCSMFSGSVAFTGTGICTLDANQAGNANYKPALETKQSLPVTRFAIATASLPAGEPRETYSSPLAAIGGTRPYMWSVSSGGLPPGLRLKKSTGIISGKPTRTDSGTYSFTVRVVDKKVAVKGHHPTQNTATAVLSITIS